MFRHYTRYLLIQYHTKHCERVPFSEDLYKNSLLKSGKLAIFGLKQNHLQLVFSKVEAKQIAGSAIFDLGFLTELPSIDPDQVKVQFIHKSLQEYLAAFYVVNTPGNEGMKLLMEFSSTSQRLMGSQIILSFIAAMSKRLGKVIQNQIKDFISVWETNDEVDPKSRTSFLIAMLKDNKKLTFPLPAILDIDLQDYDSVTGRIMNFIKSLFGQKSTLERFINMDGRGVKKINIGVGQYNRLGLLLNNSFTSLKELLINCKNSWSKDDPTDLSQVIRKNKPRLISITNCMDSLFNKDLVTKAILTQHVHTVILEKCQISKDNCVLILQRGLHLKNLLIHECGIEINAEIAKAVCDLPDETNVDLSGNKIVKMNTKLLASLINKINTQKQIDLSGLNIDIDSEIAKAVCDLPDETKIDLSGNKIVKMDKMLLISLIYKIRKQKQIDLGGANIDINSDIAKAVCNLPDETQIDLSGNKIVQMETVILTSLINKIRTQKQIDLERINIQINTEIAKTVCALSDETEIVLSGNTTVKIDTKILITLINKVRKESEVDLSGLYIRVGDREACVIWDIQAETHTDLCSNKIVKIDIKKFLLFIYKTTTKKEINLSGLNIDINTELVKCISELPEDVQIDLSDNKITDKSFIVSIIKQSTKLKSVTMRNCGIEINKQIAEAVSELNDDTKLDLSGNEITKMEAGLLGKVLKYMKKQEEINIGGYFNRWGITIDVDIVKALSNMVDLKSLELSYNTLTPSASKCLSESVRSQPQLEGLGLGVCDISNDDCVDLVSSLSKHCPRLRELRLYNNHLSSGISQVVDDVRKMNNLRELVLSGNPCMEDREEREEVENRLKISNPQLDVYTGYGINNTD